MIVNNTTVAFSTHRPEVLPFAGTLMESHDVIVLEEPPTPGFVEMLEGSLSINEYVLLTETEYEGFAEKSCVLLQRLHRMGKTIRQIEPYMETLIGIHDFFADGGTPRDIPPGTERHAVYLSEKAATGRLIAYYRTVMRGDFFETVDAVINFARADAKRFILRDKMRVDALISDMASARRLYIEAGEMHAALWQLLMKHKPDHVRLSRRYLMMPVVLRLAGKRRIFPPGDQLTLHFIFKSDRSSDRDTLLAAQAVVYNKILEKSEMLSEDHPHTRDEIDAVRTVRRLSLDDCRRLYAEIRLKRTREARQIVAEYVKRSAK